MDKRRLLHAVALFAAFALVAASCSSDGDDDVGQGTRGGTFRMQADELPWVSSGYGFDPTSEYFQVSFSMFSNLLQRPLMNYNHRSAEEGGNLPIPDLAAEDPTVSDDGLTWTFKLRQGVKWQPPLDRDVTSDDIRFAFERLATDALALAAGGYPNYYTAIEGFSDFEPGEGNAISGIETPDEYTISFKLTEPTGDFNFRVAMPATGPIPREVGSCFTAANEYGQWYMSSGPYMIEGSDVLDTSSCENLKKANASGFDFEKHMFLVRNPNYDFDRDNLTIRSALPDRYEITLNTNADDIYAKIERNEIDYGIAAVPPVTLQRYQTTESLTPLLHINPDDAVWYLTMNLATPPFDDVNVRKAANFILDKAALIRVIGGEAKGVPAEHIIPPDVLGRLPVGEFNPFGSEGAAGDLEKAKAAMAESKYDTDGDGLCDAAACNNVLHVTRNTAPFPDMAPIIEESMAKIGIKLKTSEVASFYGEAGVPSKNIPFTSGAGWGKDWADPITFIEPLFLADGIGDAGNVNLSLVGLSKAQADTLGVNFPEGGIPSVAADVAACKALTGEARIDCWAELDKKLTEEIAAWIPWRWSRRTDIVSAAVTNFTLDSFASYPSFAHMGVDTAKQVGGA